MYQGSHGSITLIIYKEILYIFIGTSSTLCYNNYFKFLKCISFFNRLEQWTHFRMYSTLQLHTGHTGHLTTPDTWSHPIHDHTGHLATPNTWPHWTLGHTLHLTTLDTWLHPTLDNTGHLATPKLDHTGHLAIPDGHLATPNTWPDWTLDHTGHLAIPNTWPHWTLGLTEQRLGHTRRTLGHTGHLAKLDT